MPTDPAKRKRLYIIIIVVCWVAAGGVLYFGYFRSNTNTSYTPPPINSTFSNTPGASSNTGDVPNIATPGGGTVFNAPAVFPNDTKFDFTLLNSQKFQALNQTPNLDLGQVGRDNPFSP